MDDISIARWNKAEKAADIKPVDALRAALHEIETGHVKPNTMIICYHKPDGSIGFYQGGESSTIFSVGLLERVKHMMLTGV